VHETSLIRDLIRHVETVAKGRRVASVSVWVGALCQMSAPHFRDHFRHAASGTIAEDARVDVQVSDDWVSPEAQSVLLRAVQLEE
jgi:hydrogenase nickel incorporation protein HypA/HybF